MARRHARGISPAARLVASRLPDVHAGVFVNLMTLTLSTSLTPVYARSLVLC